MENQIKIINSISNEEFFKLSSKALISVLSTDLVKRYKRSSLLIRDGITTLNLFLDDVTINISVSKNKIRFKIHTLICNNVYIFDYYVYKENDPHYDIINKFKKDMVKNLRQFSKFEGIVFHHHHKHIKIYLYEKTLCNYTNKYYFCKK